MFFSYLAATYVVAMSRLDYETATAMSTHRAVIVSLFVIIAPIRGQSGNRGKTSFTCLQLQNMPIDRRFFVYIALQRQMRCRIVRKRSVGAAS